MKRTYLIILLSVFCDFCYSQSLSVSSFKLLDSDLTANTAGTMEQDQNGEVAALIKVVTTQTGFTFDGGAMGIVTTKQTPGEIWVYVPKGSKKLTIKHPQLGVLRDYFYPISIESARTYEMILVAGTVQTIVQETTNNQYLIIKVSPSNAIVELNNEILQNTNGIAQKFVKLGTYDYRVQAQNYHVAAGKVTIDDPNNKKILEVNLQPAFGWIEISTSEVYNGAQVFIDNTLAGTIPMKSNNLSSGEHSVKIVKELYHPFSQKVLVKDNETTQIIPNLSANFSEVTITVDNDAEIYVNEEKKGTGLWTGKLASGLYQIEAQKNGHKTTRQNVEITSADRTKNIQLTPPIPIYGSLNITSNPAMAEVYIDGFKKGETPLFLPRILTGSHIILIKHKEYNDYSTSIIINEHDNTPIDIILNNRNMTDVILKCNIDDASLYIDGELFGKVSDLKCIEKGIHKIEVVADGFRTFVSQIDTDTLKNSTLDIILKENRASLLSGYFTTYVGDVRITYNRSDIEGFKYLGDIKERLIVKGKKSQNNQLNEKIANAAKEMGANHVLIEKYYYEDNFWIIQAKAYSNYE